VRRVFYSWGRDVAGQARRGLCSWAGMLSCQVRRVVLGRRVALPGAAPVLLPTAAISGTLCHWKDGFARFVQLVRP
jgi:hypothetical protein